MPEINLLPWREELREERKRQFLTVLAGVAILAALIGLLWITVQTAEIKNQAAVNNELQAGIDKLDKEIEDIQRLKKDKADMLDRMSVIKGLQSNRPEIVKLFDQFVRVMPEGTFVSRVEVSGNTFALEGKAESNQRISSLMRLMDQRAKFSDPNLTTVNADRELGDQGSSFEMTATIVNESEFDQTEQDQAE